MGFVMFCVFVEWEKKKHIVKAKNGMVDQTNMILI